MTGFTSTYYVNNPTSSNVTVGANTVNAHSQGTLALSYSDAQAFVTAGCTTTQLDPGVATQAEIQGYNNAGGA